LPPARPTPFRRPAFLFSITESCCRLVAETTSWLCGQSKPVRGRGHARKRRGIPWRRAVVPKRLIPAVPPPESPAKTLHYYCPDMDLTFLPGLAWHARWSQSVTAEPEGPLVFKSSVPSAA
jgi:hypothetical protein